MPMVWTGASPPKKSHSRSTASACSDRVVALAFGRRLAYQTSMSRTDICRWRGGAAAAEGGGACPPRWRSIETGRLSSDQPPFAHSSSCRAIASQAVLTRDATVARMGWPLGSTKPPERAISSTLASSAATPLARPWAASASSLRAASGRVRFSRCRSTASLVGARPRGRAATSLATRASSASRQRSTARPLPPASERRRRARPRPAAGGPPRPRRRASGSARRPGAPGGRRRPPPWCPGSR